MADPLPTYVFEDVSADFIQLKNLNLLVYADRLSDWPVIQKKPVRVQDPTSNYGTRSARWWQSVKVVYIGSNLSAVVYCGARDGLFVMISAEEIGDRTALDETSSATS